MARTLLPNLFFRIGTDVGAAAAAMAARGAGVVAVRVVVARGAGARVLGGMIGALAIFYLPELSN